jgi:hypothetical protein
MTRENAIKMNMELEDAAMNPKQESLIHAAICLLLILLSLGGLAYGVVSRLILAPDAPFTLDGILLALVCLTMLAVFGGMLAAIALREGWVKLPRRGVAPGAANSSPGADKQDSRP